MATPSRKPILRGSIAIVPLTQGAFANHGPDATASLLAQGVADPLLKDALRRFKIA